MLGVCIILQSEKVEMRCLNEKSERLLSKSDMRGGSSSTW